MTTGLLDIFKAREGIVCFTGAGGKKTTMFRLAAEHPGRIGITTTAHIEYFPRKLPASRYVDEQQALLKAVSSDHDSRVIAFATPSERRGRHAGISLDAVTDFRDQGRFDLMLVKSDGARSRLIKAPNENEPPIPDCADTVVPVVSAAAMGRRLAEKFAHRLDRLTAVTGIQPGEKLLPEHVSLLLASPEGSLKNTGRAQVVPLINMVDDDTREALARQAAELALEQTDRYDYIVLARMRDDDPIVDVICR